jgi:hypothetical protein
VPPGGTQATKPKRLRNCEVGLTWGLGPWQRQVLDLEQQMGTKDFESVEAEIQQLLRVHPELPRAQFLRYLNSTHHREFAGALEGVHRYFDYALKR